MEPSEIGAKIIEVASHFLNLHETKANAEWDDPSTPGKDPAADELFQALKRSGWYLGWPYCAAFCEAVWRMSYESLGAPAELVLEITTNFNPSVIASFNNWKGQITDKPLPGSVFFMQAGQTAKGHAGIVVKSSETHFASIEGNTSPQAGSAEADREGDGVFRKMRRLDLTPRPGLWLKGFLNPIPWNGGLLT